MQHRSNQMFRYSIVKVLFREKMFPNKSTSGWSISRILSSGLLRLCSHLSGQRIAALLGAAYPGLFGDEQPPIVHRRFHPCLALLPAGVTWPPALLQTPVVSYTTFSPSPSPARRAKVTAVCFCGPFPAGFPVPDVIRRRAPWSADFPRS